MESTNAAAGSSRGESSRGDASQRADQTSSSPNQRSEASSAEPTSSPSISSRQDSGDGTDGGEQTSDGEGGGTESEEPPSSTAPPSSTDPPSTTTEGPSSTADPPSSSSTTSTTTTSSESTSSAPTSSSSTSSIPSSTSSTLDPSSTTSSVSSSSTSDRPTSSTPSASASNSSGPNPDSGTRSGSDAAGTTSSRPSGSGATGEGAVTSSPGNYSTAQATGQGSSAGGSEVTGSAAGEQVASTDGGAIRVISPSDLATSGIDNANAATATDPSTTETGKARNPFLNDSGGLGGSQNGKVIGGSVAGIVAVLVIVVAVIWLLGKRRRKKFVRPMVERIHASGSAYSLPGLLDGSGGATGASAALGYGGMHARRRSKAFSIESASEYDPVDFAGPSAGFESSSSEHGSPSRSRSTRPHFDRAAVAAPAWYGQQQATASHYYFADARRDPYDQLPPGAVMHRAQPSGPSTTRTHSSSPSAQTQSGYYSSSSGGHNRIGGESGSASTHASSFQQQREQPRLDYLSPASEVELLDPMPHSPTLQPDRPQEGTLQRRTTDPFFGTKTSLRVVNPDDAASPTTAAAAAGQSLRPALAPPAGQDKRDSRYSVASEVSDFHYDEKYSPTASPVHLLAYQSEPGPGKSQGRKPAYLDLNRGTAGRADSPSIYTPNQVNDVKFFRDDDTV